MREKIQLWLEDGKMLIRSRYSEKYDLVIEVRHITDENAWLIPVFAPITDFDRGRLIHAGPDDFPASPVGSYGTLSGNHASPFARNILIFDHGFSDRDTGKVFTDAAGNKFCLMQVMDRDRLLIHPLPSGDVKEPDFAYFTGDRLFYDGRILPVIDVLAVQLYPSNRFVRREFLADGKTPVEPRTLTECTFLDYVMDYDVVSPGALVKMVLENPGEKAFPEFTSGRSMVDLSALPAGEKSEKYRNLPALLSYKLTQRYEAAGACVAYRHVNVPSGLSALKALDAMWIWSGEFSSMPVQEFYIPKLKPVMFPGSDGSESEVDFSGVIRFDKAVKVDRHLTQEDCLAPECQPERFIRFAGDSSRKLGFVLGYSLCYGLSSEPDRWRRIRPELYHFYNTWKMYPYIYHVSDLPENWQMDTVSYRQYFDPAADKDFTAIHFHHEYDDLIVYLECHRQLQGKRLTLPRECAGCRMEIVEKTPSFTVGDDRSDPDSPQIVVDAGNGCNYAVLRFCCRK